MTVRHVFHALLVWRGHRRNLHCGVSVASVLALLLGVVSSGCAVLDEDDRVITRAMDEHIAPESRFGRIALSPAAIPLGMVTLAVDGILVNPVRNVPDSLEFANGVFTDVESTGIGEIWVTPMRIVTWPLGFLGHEIVFCTLPLGDL